MGAMCRDNCYDKVDAVYLIQLVSAEALILRHEGIWLKKTRGSA